MRKGSATEGKMNSSAGVQPSGSEQGSENQVQIRIKSNTNKANQSVQYSVFLCLTKFQYYLITNPDRNIFM